MTRVTRPRLARGIRAFLETEAAGGTVLLVAAVVAMLWANAFESLYADVWSERLRVGPGSFSKTLDLRHWVNDGLMTVFFFVVGLEIKRELVVGELRDRRAAVVPVVAAAGGMIGPAIVYLALNPRGPASHGWGIPMATDIAFALGVLAVAGRRAPAGAKVFLLTLAIVDDIGAIGVIAIAYTEELSLGAIGVACAVLLAVALARRVGIWTRWAYVGLGIVLWLATSASGIHPTIAGVALGLMTPARPVGGRDVLEELQQLLHPVSSYVIIPLFALANAGIVVDARTLGESLRSPIFRGVAAGLVIGKCLGIFLLTVAVVRFTRARLPSGMKFRDVAAVGILGGIGFTVAIFIAELALPAGDTVDTAKIGVLIGSIASAVVGGILISVGRKGQPASKSTKA